MPHVQVLPTPGPATSVQTELVSPLSLQGLPEHPLMSVHAVVPVPEKPVPQVQEKKGDPVLFVSVHALVPVPTLQFVFPVVPTPQAWHTLPLVRNPALQV